MMPAVRTAMCRPSRSDQIATSAATSHCRAFGAAPGDRPQRTPGANQPDRKGPDGVDPAGIAGALLHDPGQCHQDAQRQRDRQQRPEVHHGHMDCVSRRRLMFQPIYYAQTWHPVSRTLEARNHAFFPPPLCHSVASDQCPDSEVRIISRRPLLRTSDRGHWQTIDLVWLWFRSPHDKVAAQMMRTSEPPHWSRQRISECPPPPAPPWKSN